jgi:general secretion pathway protein N
MIWCLTNRTLVLTVFTVTTAAMISVLPAGAESVDETGISVGTEFKRIAPHPAGVPSDKSTPGGNAVLTIPLSKLSATRDRPIFSPSRRPPPLPAPPVIARQVEPTKQAEPEQPPLILVGTVAGEGSGIAVFVEQTSENTVRLRINESHQGWTLGAIQGREVTLLKDRKSSVLALAPPGGSAEPARAQAALEPTRRQPRR